MSPDADETLSRCWAATPPTTFLQPWLGRAPVRWGFFGSGARVQARRLAAAPPSAYTQRPSPLPTNELEISVHVLLNPM